MKKKSIILTLAVAMLAFSQSGLAQGPYGKEFREALRLKDKSMEARSADIFRSLQGTDAEGYAVLSDVYMNIPGYVRTMDAYMAKAPYSVVIPQIGYAHALNLFDAGDYASASAWFAKLENDDLQSDQLDEFLFKKAYALLENNRFDESLTIFKELEKRSMTDYTAPARYTIGYINYERKSFKEATEWFVKASSDPRFKDISNYYIMECRFMLKDYNYVTANGDRMYEVIPEDRKPHFARIVSEAWLVLGDAEKARRFYELTEKNSGESKSRTDLFYSGSVLYAVDDYEGTIKSFSSMTERTDSLGQIANYHLGYSYIQTKNKVAALTAFKEAAQVGYDEVIKEDAYFNWAKLAFDINSDTSVFNDYIKTYPAKEKEDRINAYMAVAALHDRDYEGAVRAYDKIDDLDDDMTLNYMKANYLRANQLIESGSYRMAIPCLKAAAYYSDRSSRFNQLSRYWLAESYYRNDQYDNAITEFTSLYNVSGLYGRAESYLLSYNIAYSYFKKGDYTQAVKWFDTYLKESKVEYKKEALLRKGDSYFITKKYKEACQTYDSALSEFFNVNDIYPYYQAAVSYGFARKPEEKIRLLSNVMNASPNAEFYPEALFELGRSYVEKEEDDKAMECFRKLADTVKDSSYVAKAYIEMGSLSRNQSQYNEALEYYKTVVEQMPLSGYAEDALVAIESIYQMRNQPEEYLAYIEQIGKGGIKTDDEKEMMIFNAAEQIFLSENYQKALVSLQAYLDKYPGSANAYKADFYMAESYKMLAKYEQACDTYSKVIEKGEGIFVELSMLNFSDISYRLEKWEEAYGGYSSLYSAATLDNNKAAALTGMMRSAYRQHNWNEAIKNADIVYSSEQSDNQLKTEALYIKAKSYLATSRRDEAYTVFADLAKDASTPFGAEAAYLLIQDSYDKGEFTAVEEKVYALSDAGTNQVYWLAKSFIILGDSFVERDEYEQAKATFESVRDGYIPSGTDDDVLANVDMRLNKLAEMMAE